MMLVSKQQADAESDARLMAALFGGGGGGEGGGEGGGGDASGLSPESMMDALYEEDEAIVEKSKLIPSHKQLDLNEDGEPLMLRFAYVDEIACIGCTFCADVARSTFYMDEQAGRARVFNQGGDEPDVIQEAIDTCPVNCITYVDLEDLQILESEREGQVINPASIGIPATWSVSMNAIPPTKAKAFNMAGSLACCNNCPGKGCEECPMYGVGRNPVYLARLEERAAKKEASGEAAREREEAAAAANVGKLFAAPEEELEEEEELSGAVVPTGGAPLDGSTLNALFGQAASFRSPPLSLRSSLSQ